MVWGEFKQVVVVDYDYNEYKKQTPKPANIFK